MKLLINSIIYFVFFCVSTPVFSNDFSNWHEVSGGTWQPTLEHLNTLEKLIAAEAPRAAKARGQTLSTLNAYTFQYQGQISNNDKVIKIQAYCQSSSEFNPSREWLLVMDGGTCYLSALYNLNSNAFMYFEFNGDA